MYSSPDRSEEQRAEHMRLVTELKKKCVEQPEKNHFIKAGSDSHFKERDSSTRESG